MKYLKTVLILLILILSTTACEKDKLKDDYNTFEGRWRWVYTMSQSNVFDDWQTTLRPAVTGYDGTIQFHNDGTISFYKNDELLANTSFGIKSQSNTNEILQMNLDFEINKNGLKLNGQRSFSIINDTLYCSGFPFNGYEQSTDYGSTHQIINNGIFVRQ